jgi:hypothetical protein
MLAEEESRAVGHRTLPSDASTQPVHARTSASTILSSASGRSRFERHVSTISASSDMTRLTTSTSSWEVESYAPKSEISEPHSSFEEPEAEAARPSYRATMPVLRESDGEFESPMLRHGLSRGSDPNLVGMAKGAGRPSLTRGTTVRNSRQRSKSASLSSPPPRSHYSLFPSVNTIGALI